MASRLSCLAPGMERVSLDHSQAVEKVAWALEVGVGVCGICNCRLI